MGEVIDFSEMKGILRGNARGLLLQAYELAGPTYRDSDGKPLYPRELERTLGLLVSICPHSADVMIHASGFFLHDLEDPFRALGHAGRASRIDPDYIPEYQKILGTIRKRYVLSRRP